MILTDFSTNTKSKSFKILGIYCFKKSGRRPYLVEHIKICVHI
jgi:hypothetical protein